LRDGGAYLVDIEFGAEGALTGTETVLEEQVLLGMSRCIDFANLLEGDLRDPGL
jgi:hypothetical protein